MELGSLTAGSGRNTTCDSIATTPSTPNDNAVIYSWIPEAEAYMQGHGQMFIGIDVEYTPTLPKGHMPVEEQKAAPIQLCYGKS